MTYTRTPPPRCDHDLYENGEVIAPLQGPRMNTIEDYIVRVRERSGQRVDWHWVRWV